MIATRRFSIYRKEKEIDIEKDSWESSRGDYFSFRRGGCGGDEKQTVSVSRFSCLTAISWPAVSVAVTIVSVPVSTAIAAVASAASHTKLWPSEGRRQKGNQKKKSQRPR
jgi:hypothetical protein